jgi:uncharacterized phiE125 gp8 family phage protein
MGIKVITARAANIITAATLRLHCKLDATTDDTLLAVWLEAAFAYCEHYTGRSLGSQTLELALDEFPDGDILLPQGPVTSITSVTYYDTAEALQTMAGAGYALDDYSDPQWLSPAYDTDWPDTLDTVNAVKVRYVAGAATLPYQAYAAILLLVAHAHTNREAVAQGTFSEVPLGVQAMLDTLKDYSRSA